MEGVHRTRLLRHRSPGLLAKHHCDPQLLEVPDTDEGGRVVLSFEEHLDLFRAFDAGVQRIEWERL